MECIVGRTELESEDSSPSTSQEPEETSRLRSLDDFEFVNAVTTSAEVVPAQANTETPDNDEYDFRLFGAAKGVDSEQRNDGLHKIRLSSPSISKADAGLVHPERNRGYYFTKPLSDVEVKKFRSSALTGEQVRAQAYGPWPGCSYSWKVLHLPLSNVQKSIRNQELQPFRGLINEDPPAERKRPGKKYRIKLRRKQATLKAQQDASKAAAETKEAAEREKRTRRNREKKLKKKQREKAKKSTDTFEHQPPQLPGSPPPG